MGVGFMKTTLTLLNIIPVVKKSSALSVQFNICFNE